MPDIISTRSSYAAWLTPRYRHLALPAALQTIHPSIEQIQQALSGACLADEEAA